MLNKHHPFLLSVMLLTLTLVCLQAAPAKAEGIEEPLVTIGPLNDCKETMTGHRATLHCLKKHLEGAEKVHEEASHEAQQRAHTIEDVHKKKFAVKIFTDSSIAFENYRESECRRQKSLITDETEANFVYLACKTNLSYRRSYNLKRP